LTPRACKVRAIPASVLTPLARRLHRNRRPPPSWARCGRCLRHHDHKVPSFTAKEKALLAYIMKTVEADQPGTVRDFLSAVVQRWRSLVIAP
jgi:hypothetical protein